jgi:hypothetical protein
MKKLALALVTIFFFSSCSERKDQPASQNFTSPGSVVAAFVDAMNQQDSDRIKDVIASKRKDYVLKQISDYGGFKKMFEMTKGMRITVNIVGVDSTDPANVKVYTNQSVVKDTAINMKMDSLYFSAVNEQQLGWKLNTLNARPGKKYVISGEPSK